MYVSKVRERQSFASHRHTRIYVLLSRHNVFLNGTLYKMNERTFRSKEPEKSFNQSPSISLELERDRVQKIIA